MKTNTAFKYGFAMGRAEHNVSRMLFIMLNLTCVSITFSLIFNDTLLLLFGWCFSMVNLIMWLNYWSAHKLEKYFHNKARK